MRCPRNHRFGPLRHDVQSQIVIVVAPVRQHIIGTDPLQQAVLGIDQDMLLGAEATPAAALGLRR
ncbi:MAG: hypothetical protein F4Y37_07935 [Caldilineaceae bacterium SB0664_bin_22]|nr:hypothetical protein [Caldilineaceae bacterium SB0664_bin_22]MYC64013.1 hypothetical protein [Caldilineaceae bacterium SB0661_bin_34]